MNAALLRALAMVIVSIFSVVFDVNVLTAGLETLVPFHFLTPHHSFLKVLSI
jgi:hypothetical protein